MRVHLNRQLYRLRLVMPSPAFGRSALGLSALGLSVLVLLSSCSSQHRPPVLVSAAPLSYPASAQQAGVEGFVRVSYRVEADGRVSNVRVIDGQPAGVFDAAAVAAVSAWRFSPALVDGRATAVEYRESTLTFKLGDTDKYQR